MSLLCSSEEFWFNGKRFSRKQIASAAWTRRWRARKYCRCSMHAKAGTRIIDVWFNVRGRCGTAQKHRTKICKNNPRTVHRPSLSRLNGHFFIVSFYNIRDRRKIVSRHVAFVRIAHVHLCTHITAILSLQIFFFSYVNVISLDIFL